MKVRSPNSFFTNVGRHFMSKTSSGRIPWQKVETLAERTGVLDAAEDLLRRKNVAAKTAPVAEEAAVAAKAAPAAAPVAAPAAAPVAAPAAAPVVAPEAAAPVAEEAAAAATEAATTPVVPVKKPVVV